MTDMPIDDSARTFNATLGRYTGLKPKIRTDLIALRKKIGGLKAEKKGGVMFPVKSAKDLMVKLRDAADELGMVMAGAPINVEFQERALSLGYTDEVTTRTTFSEKTEDDDASELVKTETKRTERPSTIVTCKMTIRFMSDDGSFEDFVGFGQGGDTQDKAGGKASTYAWKDALTKALSLPDADMVDTDDEQPFEEPTKKEPERPLGKILKQFADATTLADVETAKNEVKKYTWGPGEREQLQGALIKAKGRLSK
jgi:hypothetical protein